MTDDDVTEATVAELAEAVGLPLAPERRAPVTQLVQTLVADGGGATAEEVTGVEPAMAFDPRWPS